MAQQPHVLNLSCLNAADRAKVLDNAPDCDVMLDLKTCDPDADYLLCLCFAATTPDDFRSIMQHLVVSDEELEQLSRNYLEDYAVYQQSRLFSGHEGADERHPRI